MNPVHDPTRKTSINSLLNPQDASFSPHSHGPLPLPIPHSPSHVHHHSATPQMPPLPYASPHRTGASYNLRAADWDTTTSRQRHPIENTASLQHNHYHDSSSHMPTSVSYPDHDARIHRQRVDDHVRYPSQGQMWMSAQQDVAGMPYAPKPPHNSTEREGELPECLKVPLMRC
jgi:lysine-specific demethylase 3